MQYANTPVADPGGGVGVPPDVFLGGGGGRRPGP